MNKARYLILFLSLYFTSHAFGQEMILIVERCKALDQTSPIYNVWVDEENVKWVANKKGLYKVLALDLVQSVAVPSGQTNLLTIRGGNANITWNTNEMNSILDNAAITSASYDPKTKSLWIGTKDEGAFQVSVSPLRVTQRFNVDNRRLTSNQINDIFVAENGTVWIATNDGMLTGNGDKWNLQERYLNFIGVDAWGKNMWIMGDDFLWQVDSKGKWSPIAIDMRNVEGTLRDIAVDDEGRVWIASNMMTGYNVEASIYQRFGPGQYFTSQYANCLDVDQDGSIWTGTLDKGLYLIQWEAAMTINILSDAQLDCKVSQPTAGLSVKVTGGEAPYTYAWNSGQTTEKISQIPAGKYELTVTDAKGITKTARYEIPDPSIDISYEVIKPASGAEPGDGHVNLLLNGGTGAFVYKWDNGEDKQSATKLTSGTHSVTVTDENGCSASISFQVPERVAALSATLSNAVDNKCANGTDGEIQVNVTGGKPPLKYRWSNGSSEGAHITGLAPGSYTVTITDAANQTFTAAINLLSPPAMVLTAEVISPAGVSLSNGQAQVKATGGKGPSTYKRQNGETAASSKTLASGLHSVTVTDANGCTMTTQVDVAENITKLGFMVKQVGQINCNGQATASLRPEISGGKGPYTYLWSDGSTGATADNLKAGNYSLTVTDAVGNAFTSTTVITEPSLVVVTVTMDSHASTNASDAKATAKAAGGTSPYQYAWDNGEMTAKALKLNAGNHVLTVTDAAGCSATSSITVSENILPLQVVVDQPAQIKCHGSNEGSLKATVKAGKAPYKFAWSNAQTTEQVSNLTAGEYSLTVSDAAGNTSVVTSTISEPALVTVTITPDAPASTNGSDGKATVKAVGGTPPYQYMWDSGENLAKAIKLKPGDHIVTVTDASGCSSTGVVSVSENILALNVVIEQTSEILCANTRDGSIRVTVSGGKEPYQYAWAHNANTPSLEQLGDGVYTLVVTDALGHTANSVISLKSPAPMSVTLKVDQAASTNQEDGKAIAVVTGGTGKYTYAWDSGETTVKALGLGAGAHTLTVTDENGCTATASIDITENILPLVAAIKQVDKITCAGSATASVQADIKGGKPPYSYAWTSNGKSLTGESINQISAGTVSLKVTDQSGTTSTAQFDIIEPKPILVEIVEAIPASTGNADGQITVKVSGGTGAYTINGAAWPTGKTSHIITGLKPGEQTLTIKDAAGCWADITTSVKENILPLVVTIRQPKSILCAGNAEASLESTVKGGKPPYTYTWNQEPGSSSLNAIGAGTYKLEVTDVSGLKGEAEIKVTAPAPLGVEIVNLRSATNDRLNDGKGGVQVKGGTAPFTYQWSSGETRAQATKLPLGNGTLVVTDANNCKVTADFVIKQKVLPELTSDRLASGEPIRMEKIQFEADSVKIYPEAVPSLDELYEFLYDNPTTIIEVSGHTNGLPADDYCDRISTERAQSVSQYLIDKGIEARRVIAKGYGKRKPVATNQTPEGRKKNQRVEIRLIKIEE